MLQFSRMKKPALPSKTPTVARVTDALQQWNSIETFKLQESSLELLFHKLCPRNEDPSQVLLKVSVLNHFYSTMIFNTPPVAQRICSLHVDERLAAGDLSLVEEMMQVKFGDKVRNLYSFASKYCSRHNPEVFPIFDSYVERMLLRFRRQDGFATFKNVELRQYERFVEIIHAFRKHYGLEQFSIKQIDAYLWLEGKAAFAP
jgi:hypothetical protein